jgi:hypothetical protein
MVFVCINSHSVSFPLYFYSFCTYFEVSHSYIACSVASVPHAPTHNKYMQNSQISRSVLVLWQLCDAGSKFNAAKSTFCALEIEYLGYVLTRDGIKPQSNKVKAILAIKPPTGVRQLRHFLGMVQYYRDLWARWSKMLAPLTSLGGECSQTKTTKAKGTKEVPWHWDEVHQKAFNHVKATIAKDVVLAYPDFNKVFEIYIDASVGSSPMHSANAALPKLNY